MKTYLFGGVFALSNRLQLLGDKYDPNISTKQWFLIAVINSFHEEVPTISMTANRIGSSRQNIKKMAVILEKRGFINIVKDNEDARIQRLELTTYCKEYFGARQEGEEKFIDAVFEEFDEELLTYLYRGMQQLEKNINKMENNLDEEE